METKEQIKQLVRDNKTFLFKAIVIFILVLLAVGGYDGDRENNRNGDSNNIITISGHGEVQAVPDIATLYFTVESSKATQQEASTEVNTKTNQVLAFIKESGVAEKDIKTEGYNSYPKYSDTNPCPIYSYKEGGIYPPCPQTEAKIVGYTVSQNFTVKVRKVDDVSKVIDGINKIGVTNMSGPTFAIDDEDGLKAEARKEAIKDAKEKAKVLSRDLGVRLGHITSFNENGSYYPVYNTASYAKDSATGAPVPSQLPKGENTVSADVTITYEIR